MEQIIKIGTRGSPLALAQAHDVCVKLQTVLDVGEDQFEIVVIRTSGDKIQDRPLSEVGGKGLFTKEIEDALLEKHIDIAVHSLKDMPVLQPDGLTLTSFLTREDYRDGFVSNRFSLLSELPKGSVLGTSSLRRRAQILYARPDLKLVEFRGNVQTRLAKLADGVADATLLAMAGLNRLGQPELANPISVDEMLPAICQGIVAIEQRVGDIKTHDILSKLNNEKSMVMQAAERAFLEELDGSCQTPIAGLATIDGDQLLLRGELILPDGSDRKYLEKTGYVSNAAMIGKDLAMDLKSIAGPKFMEQLF